jgi:CheY-like chemotaxis protein
MPDTSDTRRRHVLVVDDDADIREIARLSLELVAGWEVAMAANGLQALSMVDAGRPDIILLDMMMPGMDGCETYRRLAHEPRTQDIPVVFLTAKAGAEHLVSRGTGSLCGVIAKPFDPMTLAATIDRMIDGCAP